MANYSVRILVPRVRAPFGQHQESRPLASGLWGRGCSMGHPKQASMFDKSKTLFFSLPSSSTVIPCDQCIFTIHFILCSGCAWEIGNPVMLHIGESAAVSCMTAIHGRLWCGLGCNAVIVNTTTLVVEVRLSFLSFLHC